MNLIDLPWGFWNGLTAWIILVVHVFGGWSEYPVFDIARAGTDMTLDSWSVLARRYSEPPVQAREAQVEPRRLRSPVYSDRRPA